MNEKQFKSLANELNTTLEEYNNFILSKDFDSAKSRQKRILLLEDAISRNKRKRKHTWLVPAGIGLLCLLLVASSFKRRTTHINFKGEFMVAGLSFGLLSRWELGSPLAAKIINITNLTAIESSALGLHAQHQPHFTMSIKSDSLPSYFYDLSVSDTARVTIKSGRDRLELLIKNDSLVSTVLSSSASVVTLKGSSPKSLVNESATPEPIVLSTHRLFEDPARFVFQGIGQWTFPNIHASSLKFEKEVLMRNESVQLESSVISGRLTVVETGREFTFQEGDIIKFINVATKRMSISPDGEAMRITLEGSASEIEGGIDGFEEKLSPTLAEYLYRQQTVAFFYSSFVFLWGFLWSAWKLFLNGGK